LYQAPLVLGCSTKRTLIGEPVFFMNYLGQVWGDKTAHIYTPRQNQDRLFHAIFKNHWHSFASHFPDEIKPHHEKIIKRFIECGDPKKGFALVECPNCDEAIGPSSGNREKC